MTAASVRTGWKHRGQGHHDDSNGACGHLGNGLFVVSGETRNQELGTQSVRALAPDGQGSALAIVNGRSLRRRAPDGM